MELSVHVNRTRCMGSGQCVHWAPGVFSQDDEGISVVIDPHGESEEKIVTATTACPVEAIRLEVDGTPIVAGDLAHWTRGAFLDEPLVSLLEELTQDHNDLRTRLRSLTVGHNTDADGSGDSPAHNDEVAGLIDSYLAHQALEQDAGFSALHSLVVPPLVKAFHRGHAQIRRVVDRLSGDAVGSVLDHASVVQFAVTLDRQIRLEEAVLFRVALGKLASKPNPDDAHQPSHRDAKEG